MVSARRLLGEQPRLDTMCDATAGAFPKENVVFCLHTDILDTYDSDLLEFG